MQSEVPLWSHIPFTCTVEYVYRCPRIWKKVPQTVASVVHTDMYCRRKSHPSHTGHTPRSPPTYRKRLPDEEGGGVSRCCPTHVTLSIPIHGWMYQQFLSWINDLAPRRPSNSEINKLQALEYQICIQKLFPANKILPYHGPSAEPAHSGCPSKKWRTEKLKPGALFCTVLVSGGTGP